MANFIKIEVLKNQQSEKIAPDDPLLGQVLYLKIDRINDKKKFTDLEVGEPFLAKVSPNGRKIMMCVLVTNTLYTEQQVKEAEDSVTKKDSVTLSYRYHLLKTIVF